MGPQAQIALVIADFGACSDQEKARMVSVGICSGTGTQSQRKGNERLDGVQTFCFDNQSLVRAFGADHHNAHLDASISELRIYVTVAAELHSSRVAMARMAVATLTADYKSTGTTSAHLHRTATGKPRRGKAGAAAREADAVARCSTSFMAHAQAERLALVDMGEADDG